MLPALLVILTFALYWFPIRRWMNHAIEPAGFVMTRRMLLGLKQQAEALRVARMRETQANQRPAA